MPSCLVDLPTELHLKIAEQLHIPRLKVGIIGCSIGQLIEHDRSLKDWSCTCPYFRDLLTPYIFKTVKLRNDDNSAMSLLELSESRHKELVKELQFIGSCPNDLVSADRALTDIQAIFPDNANKILSELHRFPTLETVGITFVYQFEYDDNLSLNLPSEEENDEEVQKAEKEKAWRALMAKTYSALTQNEAINFRSLEIKDLAPCRVSTFDDPAFHNLLSRLERFTLSFFESDDNGEDWITNRYNYFSDVVTKLDKYFFNHIRSATAFTLQAKQFWPIGSDGYTPLALNEEQMPFIKRLHLEYIYVCPQLIDFLLAHVQTLEHVTLHNCASSVDSSPKNPIPWHQLFNALADANPQHLSYFRVTHTTNSLETSDFLSTHNRLYGEEEDCEKAFVLTEQCRRILEADDSRNPWDHYGLLKHVNLHDGFMEEGELVVSFRKPKDQASYERLMRIVDANAARSGEARARIE